MKKLKMIFAVTAVFLGGVFAFRAVDANAYYCSYWWLGCTQPTPTYQFDPMAICNAQLNSCTAACSYQVSITSVMGPARSDDTCNAQCYNNYGYCKAGAGR